MILHMIWPPDISIIVYQGQVWWYLSMYHGTCAARWRGLGAPGARPSTSFGLDIAHVLGTCVQPIQLEIASLITMVHSLTVCMLWHSFIHWLSVCFDSLCPIKMVLTEGLHGASHSSLWTSLKAQSAIILNPSCNSPHVGRGCWPSYKYTRTITTKRSHDAIAKCVYLILWVGSWIGLELNG